MSAGPQGRAREAAGAQRARRSRIFLAVLALGLLTASFGTWETVAEAPTQPFGADSPWVLTRYRPANAWGSGLHLPAGSLPNAVPVLLAFFAALAGAAGLGPRLWTGVAALVAVLAIGAFVLQAHAGDGRVGEAAVVSTFLALLVGALVLTEATLEAR